MELSRTTGVPLDRCVTASQLVRNFGVWQDRAARHPVYVMHRGRPRLALTSIEVMEALCETGHGSDGDGADRDRMLEALDQPVLLLDGSMRIVASNNAARGYWQLGSPSSARPVAVDAGLPAPLGMFVQQAALRVSRQRITERIEVGQAEAGPLALTLFPLADGVGVIARDLSVEERAQTAVTAFAAVDAALHMLDGVARLRVNSRGYVADAGGSFVRMSGVSADALRSARFVSLIEIGSRVAVAETIEAALRSGTPASLSARLLRNNADPLSVRIGIASVDRNLVPQGVEIVLVES